MKAFAEGIMRYMVDIIRYNVAREVSIDDLDDDCFRLMLPREDDDGNDNSLLLSLYFRLVL